MTDLFETIGRDWPARLIDGNPLAWIMPESDPLAAALMPVLCETDAEGRPASLLGHLPRSHPMVDELGATRRAIFLFQGPHAYITPEWLGDKDWAPTWNFTALRILASVELSGELTDEALARTVAHMERGRAERWEPSRLGDRYERLRDRVIGFRATILALVPRFKLGQDEREEVFGEILAGLGEHPLADWMREARRA